MYTVKSTDAFSTPFMPGACEAWGRLHTERQDVCQALLEEGKAIKKLSSDGVESDRLIEDVLQDLEWQRREALQERLRQIDDALDRLMAGFYGHCSSCGKSIDDKRLSVDPAAAQCISCQETRERERTFQSL